MEKPNHSQFIFNQFTASFTGFHLKCERAGCVCVDAGDSVVILADRTLLEFPLEALSVLQTKGIGSVSRDFSLQVLHTRLQTDEAGELTLNTIYLF